MAVTLGHYEAGTKAIAWDPQLVDGEIVEIWADNPADGAPMEFKKKAVNDGLSFVVFPEGYSGTCNLEVRGENSEDTGTIEI